MNRSLRDCIHSLAILFIDSYGLGSVCWWLSPTPPLHSTVCAGPISRFGDRPHSPVSHLQDLLLLYESETEWAAESAIRYMPVRGAYVSKLRSPIKPLMWPLHCSPPTHHLHSNLIIHNRAPSTRPKMAPAPVWFITAASSGFGHEIALLALKRGHTVVATARNASRIQDLADAGAHTLSFDVTTPLSDIEAIAKDIFAKHGRVDYLINAAGFILEGSVEESSPEEVHASFNTNVFGAFNAVKAFLPGMRAQDMGENDTRGTVVTFGSVGSWSGGASYSVYAMTKSCMSSLAESLRAELAPFNIVATVVEPGYFRTNFLNPGVKVTTKQRIPAYDDEDTPTGKARRFLDNKDSAQEGDVKKGCRVVVDVLTRRDGREVPVRIVLGKDCEAFIRGECERTVRLLDEWKSLIVSTDHDE